MAKFGVGDTVVGNSANLHGVTGEDCVVIVTKAGPTSFSGIVDEHPDDDDQVGTNHDGLKYEWFDLEDEGAWDDDDWAEEAASLKPNGPKLYADMAWVRTYEGQRARIIGHDYYFHERNCWVCTILLDNDDMVEVYETELKPYDEPKKAYATTAPVTMSYGDAPKDVKIWGRVFEDKIVVKPAHEKEVVPIKQHYVLTPSFDNAFDPRRTKKKGHIKLRTDN